MPKSKGKKFNFLVFGKTIDPDSLTFYVQNENHSHQVRIQTHQIDWFRGEIEAWWRSKDSKDLPAFQDATDPIGKQRSFIAWFSKLAKSKKLCGQSSPIIQLLGIPDSMKLGEIGAGARRQKKGAPDSGYTVPLMDAPEERKSDSLEDTIFPEGDSAREDSAQPPPQPPPATEVTPPLEEEQPPPIRHAARVSGPAPDPSSFGLEEKERAPSADPPSPERSPGPQSDAYMREQEVDANRQLFQAKDHRIAQLESQLKRAKIQLEEGEAKANDLGFRLEATERKYNQEHEDLMVYRTRFGTDVASHRVDAAYKSMVDDSVIVSVAVLTENQTLVSKVKLLKDKLKQKDLENRNLRSEVTHLNGAGSVDRLRGDIERQNVELRENHKKLLAAADDKSNLEAEKRELQTQLQTMEAQTVPKRDLRIKTEEIADLNQQVNKLREDIQKQNVVKEKLEAKVQDVQDAESKRYNDMRREKDDKIGTLQSEVTKLTKENAALTKERDELNRKLNPPEVPPDEVERILTSTRPDRAQLCKLKKEDLANKIIGDAAFIQDLEDFDENAADASEMYIKRIQLLEAEIVNLEDALKYRGEEENALPADVDIDMEYIRDLRDDEFVRMFERICPGEPPLMHRNGTKIRFLAPKEDILRSVVEQDLKYQELEELVDSQWDMLAEAEIQRLTFLAENVELAQELEISKAEYLDAVHMGTSVSKEHVENARRINENLRNANRARRRLDGERIEEIRSAQSILRTRDSKRLGSSTGRRTPSLSRQGSTVDQSQRLPRASDAPNGSVYYNEDGTVDEDSIRARARALVETLMAPEYAEAEDRIMGQYSKNDAELTEQLMTRNKEELVNECIGRYKMCEQLKKDATENAALLFATMEINDHKKDLEISQLEHKRQALERRLDLDEDLKRMLQDGTPASVSAHIEKLRRINDYLEVQMRRMRDAFNKNDQDLFEKNVRLKQMLRQLGKDSNGETFEPVSIRYSEHMPSRSPSSSVDDAKVEEIAATDGSAVAEVPNGLLTFKERKAIQAKLEERLKVLNEDRAAFEQKQKEYYGTIEQYKRTIHMLVEKTKKMKASIPAMKEKFGMLAKKKIGEARAQQHMMLLQAKENIRELTEEVGEIRRAKQKVSEELTLIQSNNAAEIASLKDQLDSATARLRTLDSEHTDLHATLQTQRQALADGERLFQVLQRTELDRNVFERKLREEHLHVLDLQQDKVVLLEQTQREIDRLRGEIALLARQGRRDLFGNVVPLTMKERQQMEENERIAKEEYERAIAPISEKVIVTVKDGAAALLANASAVISRVQNNGQEAAVDANAYGSGMLDVESIAEDQREGEGEGDADDLQQLRDLLEQHQVVSMLGSDEQVMAAARQNAYPRVRNRRELRDYQDQNRQSPRAVMAMWQQVQPEYDMRNPSEVIPPSDFDLNQDRRRKRGRRDRRNDRDREQRPRGQRRRHDDRERRQRRDRGDRGDRDRERERGSERERERGDRDRGDRDRDRERSRRHERRRRRDRDY